MGRGGAWVDLAPLGGSLKQRDPSFSSQTYGGFQKLTDLLEAAPDLVDLDRSQNRARLKQPADLKRLLQGALTQLAGNPADGNDWIHLSSIKLKLNEIYPAFSIPKYGYEKFKDFLADRPDLIELRRDESALHPIYYGRLKPSARPAPPPQPKPPLPLPTKPSDKLAIAGRSPSPKPKLPNLAANPSANPSASLSANLSANPSASFSPSDYGDFARSAAICTKLAALALPEPWHWGPATSPAAHPILSHYLNYSFLRLHQEGKVLVSASGTYSAFHTGLLDRKYEPIYALFVALSGEERRSKQAAWSLFDFCVPGEGSAGKTLVNQFDALPERANYFTQPEAAFYDCNAEAPMVDWRHILQDNSDRLPLGFWQAYCPSGFALRDLSELSPAEQNAYKQQLAQALTEDPETYGAIAQKCQAALTQAILKVQINYRTAIPFYNPRSHRLQLLLPLSLMEEDGADATLADCALVVDRQAPDKPYLGHTILPLGWAYQNARLLGRLESPWLRVERGDQSGKTDELPNAMSDNAIADMLAEVVAEITAESQVQP